MELQASLYDVFRRQTDRYADHPFLAVPERLVDAWQVPSELSYAQTLQRVDALQVFYRDWGVQAGDRIALAFESRPQYFFHYLALNALGACVVPLNTDLTAQELAYQLQHSQCNAIVGLASLQAQLKAAQALLPVAISLVIDDQLDAKDELWRPHAHGTHVGHSAQRAAAILYTSGTTGKPKGCVLSNVYLQEAALYNARLPGDIALIEGAERVLNPLPLYHMNSMVSTAGSVMLTGGCFVLPGRFSASNWWSDIAQTRATRFNYLGIMIPALLGLPESPAEKAHQVRCAFGAGVDPAIHQRFEQRFGIPLMEVWGMTETGRFLIVDREPRHIDTRACGRALPGLEAKLVDDAGQEVADTAVGELVVRHSAQAPRHGFFSGYLDDPAATEAAWAGGWFHSGDLCTRAPDGMFTFVDRKKNIVRRSGENISSAEVEATLAESSLTRQVSVLAVPDTLRDEEVLACVVLSEGQLGDAATAHALVQFAAQRLAYYKVPGWIYFVDALPVTGTQKVQKHRIFPNGQFAPDLPGLYDLRALKKRHQS